MNSHAPPLPPDRLGVSANAKLAERRIALLAAIDAGLFTTDSPPIEVRLNGVRALRFVPNGPSKGDVLHFHGGAFRLGAPEVVGRFAAALSARCGVTVTCPAYRLAPENPFPAALRDGFAVVQAMQSCEQPFILSGDSAGGGLAATLAALLRDIGLRPVRGLILLSPWLDLTVTNTSFDTNADSDPLFSRAAATEAAEAYLQGISAREVLVSPLLGFLQGLPPTLLSVGLGEVLADDCHRFHAALRSAGVNVRLSAIGGMEHVAVTRGFNLTGSAETFEAVCTFTSEVTATQSSAVFM